MSLPHRLVPLSAALACSFAALSAATTNNLPVSAALPLGSSTTAGFAVRVAQAPTEATVANNSIRALRQINGTLTDATGALVPNVAAPGEGAGGTYPVDLTNFEKDGAFVDILDYQDTSIVLGSFFTQAFPGIPGNEGSTDKFAAEVVGFLELPAGVTTLGVSTTTERTDANDDDGYQLFVGTNPRDFFNLKVGEYERIAPGFQAGWRNENQIIVSAPTAGLYPFRILYWQTGNGTSVNGASLLFYTINPTTGERILINDTSVAGALKAYRDSSVAAAVAPYIAEAEPPAGSEGNSASAPIQALIVDGAATVATSDVKLYLNDAPFVPQTLTKANGKITLKYDPNANRTNPNNLVRLEYRDSAGVTHTNSWSFGITTVGGSSTQVTGQWDFENGDLSATVGKPLTYFDPTFDGPTGTAEDKTAFGTTTALGLADIGGKPAKIMRIPGTKDRRIGYVMDHGIKPNGGGTKVNQYTLIMDVMVAPGGASSLLQTSSLNNTDDGDLFWQGSNFGQGGGDGYAGRGNFTAGEWHRIVAAYDEAANPPVVVKFVDGIKQDDWTSNQGLDDPRRTLQATAILFGDGDQDERNEMWVNSIQIRNGRISDAEAFLLGGPTADGIPQVIPTSNVTGQWDFEFGDLGASIGSNLQYFDPTFDGPEGTAEDKTTFGTTTELSLADIGGQPAKIMRIPGTKDRRIGYIMDHRIAPNGGGTKVNQYTLIMDVMVAPGGASSLLQTSSLNNTDDGDLFWQGSNFGQGGGDGYAGRGNFTAGEWHRIVAAYDEAANPPVVVKFVDGIKQDDWTSNQGLDDPRRTLQATAILFGDGDQDERNEMWVSAIQIRSARISDVEAALLGGPVASGIPVALPKSTVTGQWDFEYGDLGASVGSNLQFFDPTFDGPEGTAEDKTTFGTTTELGITDIDGQPAKIMRIPGTKDRRIGFVMDHRIAPNGGGTRVNQYTLIMDIMVAPGGASSLLQTSSLSNTDDGDLFWQGSNFGQGGGDGYAGTGAFTAGEWHRIVAAYDEAANPPVVYKYVDGIFQDDWTSNQALDDPRRTLLPTAILFADGDQDERNEMWVSAVQIRSGVLSAAEMEALGGPSSRGIPYVIQAAAPPTVSATTDASGNLVITFTGTLQSSPTLGGTFAPVAGATSPYTVPKAQLGAQQLYRSSN